ncbi:MAG: isochorismatase family protein [Algisphaera sp.]
MSQSLPESDSSSASIGTAPTAAPICVQRLDPKASAVLLIDLQERLVPVMHERRTLVRRAKRLVDGANVIEVPVLVAEQYVRGLGETVHDIAPQMKGAVLSDAVTRLSAATEKLLHALERRKIRSVVLAGIEAHVGVLHTALDLLDAGFTVAVCHDAVSSRRPVDLRSALSRMTHAGVLPTTVESALMELLGSSKNANFKNLREIIRSDA